MNSSPKVSIIIAVYNGAETLQCCLDSIASQTYPNIELIIMDAGSTDGTVNIIKANESTISYWESKPDKGIYHAWNKALSHATGEWIAFIGADDAFAYTDVLTDMIGTSCKESCNFISGRMKVFFDRKTIEKGEPWDLKQIRKWQNIAHPGALHHKSLFEKFGVYNEDYKIAGDYEFLLRASKEIKACFLDEVVVHMGGEGVSHANVFPALVENLKIQKNCKDIGMICATINFIIAYAKSIVRDLK